jgi:hypothetical protein
MKKYLLFFSAAVLVLSVRSQSGAGIMLNIDNAEIIAGSSSSGDQSFMATLSTGENLVATPIKDGSTGYINIKKVSSDGTVSTVKNIISDEPLLGLTCSSTGNFTCFFGSTTLNVMKFSPSGMVIWQKALTIGEAITPYYGSRHSMLETPSGDYYLTLSNFSFTGLVKIDANGNLLWSYKMTGPRDTGKCPGFCSAVTQDGGCITTLKDENYETLILMDPSGNKTWSRSFGDASYRWTRSIKADNLGNFYIMGTYGNIGATFIQKVDANGNIIYAKNLSETTCYFDSYLSATNEFYIITETPSVKLTKVGPTGNILWSRGIGAVVSPAANYFGYFTSTQHLADLNFLGTLNDSTGLVFSISSPAELCNSYNYAVPTTVDDVQIFEATIDSTANINPLAVTIANTGLGTTTTGYFLSGDFCSYIASVNENAAVAELNIFPNPATDHLTIALDNIKIAPGTVTNIYDMTGRKVYTSALDNSTFMNISTAGFAPGLYTVVISGADKILGKQRVVIQK